MIKFARAEKAEKPKKQYVEAIAYFQAIILVVIAFMQLYDLQDFLAILQNLDLGTRSQTYLMGCFIIWAEIFSLPFLLRMKLSFAFRAFSMFLLWSVTIFWLYLSVWLTSSIQDPVESGLLGGIVPVESGIQLFVFAILFGACSINNIWGLRPLKRNKLAKLLKTK